MTNVINYTKFRLSVQTEVHRHVCKYNLKKKYIQI